MGAEIKTQMFCLFIVDSMRENMGKKNYNMISSK